MLSGNLKTLRKAKGFSQEELAIRLNVVRQTVSKWEKGLSVPDADLLIQLAEILDVSVSKLLGTRIENEQEINTVAKQLSRINGQLATKILYKRLYIVYSIILAVGIMFFGDFYLKSLNRDYFIEIESVANHVQGIIYIGNPTSPDCRRFEPIIRDISREERIKVFYFNTENLKATANVESSVTSNYVLDNYVESIPTIIVVRSGVAVEVFDEALHSSSRLPIKAHLLTALLPYKSMSNDVTPYCYVSIGLLCISAIFLIVSIFLKKEKLGEYLYFPIICVDICMFSFLIRNFAMPVGYIERHGYNGNVNSSYALLVAMAIMVISNAVLVTRIKDRLNDAAS